MKYEIGRIWKTANVSYFKVQLWHLSEGLRAAIKHVQISSTTEITKIFNLLQMPEKINSTYYTNGLETREYIREDPLR
jgi:hypothetical protein